MNNTQNEYSCTLYVQTSHFGVRCIILFTMRCFSKVYYNFEYTSPIVYVGIILFLPAYNKKKKNNLKD